MATAAAAAAVAGFPFPAGTAFVDSLATCGITMALGQWVLTMEGIDSMDTLGEITPKDVDDMCASMARKRAEEGKWNMPMQVCINVKSLVWWIRDYKTKGQQLPAAGFMAADFDVARQDMQLMQNGEAVKNPVEMPRKFNTRNWISW